MKNKKLIAMALLTILTIGMQVSTFASSIPSSSISSSRTLKIADEKKEGFKGEYIVGIEYLKEKVNDSNTIILDARGEKKAKSGKLESAYVISWQEIADTASKKAGEAGWGHILPKEELEKILGRLGLSKDKEIIIYSDGNAGWGEDGRILWELKACGYENIKILDGGIQAIKKAGLNINNEIAKVEPVEVKIDSVNYDEVIDTDQLKADYDRYIIVDSREADEYKGATKFGEAKGGHLPGAINIPYSSLYNENNMLKSNDEIKEIFRSAGLSEDKAIVVYCTGGIRSALMQQLMLMCGYTDVKNYEGSYYNWASTYDVEK